MSEVDHRKMAEELNTTLAKIAAGLNLPLTVDKERMQRERIFAHRLDNFKDRHRGKRCFVVGNGPSLAETPLEKMIGEYTFGMNRISLIFDKTNWSPTFYTMVTVAVQDPHWAESARQVIDSGIRSFVWWPLLAHVIDWPLIPRNVSLLECSHAKTETEEVPLDEWWSWDIGERVCKHGTSMLAALQIAVYMGFNPIYLVGADNYWEPFDYEEDKDPNHFDDAYWQKLSLTGIGVPVDERQAYRYTHQCTTAHELAYRVTKSRGINIYNATIGGKLEVYPRVDFRWLFNEADSLS